MQRAFSTRLPRFAMTLLAGAMAAPAMASPPPFMDVRSMGMAGTGVASARPSAAAYHNPALLSVKQRDWQNDFAVTLPGVYGRFADEEDVPDQVDVIQQTIQDLDNSINQGDPQQAREDAGRLADQLEAVDEDTMRVDAGAGLNVAKPGLDRGLGFHMGGRLRATVQGNISQNDIERLRNIENNTVNFADFNRNELESRGRVMATAVLETGITFSTQADFAGQRIAIGITPKYMQLRTFDYIENVDDFEDNEFDASEHETTKNGFNLDLGAALQAGDRDQWLYGVSVRNVIPMDLKGRERPTDLVGGQLPGEQGQATMELRPLITAGVAYTSRFASLSAEMDLTRTRSFGPEAETQWLALGGEINVIDWINLRGGIRQNLASDTGADGIEEKTQYSAGLALSPWALRIELGALYSDQELGASAELGVAF
ncbi:MAG: conjugal transfer protein TraF [Oleiphilaceae bacterium]|nr:conjugal transfer protein TraF [Oleiphilaceae bacterium]